MNEMINTIIQGECLEVMRGMPSDFIDLSVTSPPYDNLRTYNGFEWDFEGIAKELYRVTKEGGVVVWVVGDETKDFAESLSSFRQAIFFVECCGFKLLDTMIYEKSNYAPAYPSMRRYAQTFEYMFVLVKGKRPGTFNPVQIKKAQATIERQRNSKGYSFRQADGTLRRAEIKNERTTKDASNVWKYSTGAGNSSTDKIAFRHPAIFPEKLAENHIFSWSNPGDVVLDPFVGSGTTAKMAVLNDRKYVGIDISEEYVEIARRRIDEAYKTKGSR